MDTFVAGETPRRWAPLKLIAAAILLLVGTPCGLWLWVNSAAERKWARMLARTAELEAESPATGGPRPVIDPHPLPGNAWDDYNQAALGWYGSSLPSRFLSVNSAEWATRNYVHLTDIASIIANRPELIEYLRLGARRTHAEMPEHFQVPWRYAWAALTAVSWADYQCEQGRAREGIELFGVALQFGRDLAALGTEVSEGEGWQIETGALNVLKGRLRKGMAREDLEEVGRILLFWEQNLPSCRAGLRESLAQIRKCFAQWNLGIDGAELRVWRNAWTARIGVTRAFEHLERCVARLEAREGEPWSGMAREFREVEQELSAYPDPHPDFYWFGGNILRSLESRAIIRILRAAAQLLATGKFVPLADPFGDTLRCSQDEKGFKIWSVGPDGIDQKGQPLEELDLVFEVLK